MLPRVRLIVSRRAAGRLGWIATLMLGCAVGWGVGRIGAPPSPAESDAQTVLVARAEGERRTREPVDAEASLASAEIEAPRRQPDPPRERPATPAAAPPEPAAAPPEPAAPPKRKAAARPEPRRPIPQVARPEKLAASPREPPQVPAAADVLPAEMPEESALDRARRTDRLAEAGEEEGARAEADRLLAELPSYSDMIAAFVEDGANETRAQLAALRVLQVAGHDAISQQLARELRRSYASSPEVSESIRNWRILTPRITAVDSSIENDRFVVVSGTVENPDIGDVRRVRIVVEALDAAGGLLATTEARVRPSVLAPEGRGDFTARFKRLDPTGVLRTRAFIVEWESEVRSAG